ncbi:Similar to Ent-kaurene oxidase; acc. no. Q701P2 [Pyronema omphalodes CBS 100304]|uniref:Similar to Ent-kaurene oxidase acc. no. Q701P2 n=1 Tax=Pyronema omphalodes (strain CBS 100304) TaxID=1076935 RepID=U4LRA3_PYROM|nr:Similar to Ent-kaurene oxidase; acc. no. Q701P2 [Pyronema omphalodes CBS 100304]
MALIEYLSTNNTAISAVLVCIIITALNRLFTYINGLDNLKNIPSVGFEGGYKKARERFLFDNLSLMKEGYKKDGAFKVVADNGKFQAMVSPNMAMEMRNTPNDVLSFTATTRDLLMTEYTGIQESDTAVKCVRLDLTKNHGRLIPAMAIETKWSFDKHFGECKEWTKFQIHPMLLQVVAVVSGVAFVGNPENRNPDWLDCAINYTVDVFSGTQKLRQKLLPKFLLPITARLSPEISRTKQHRIKARRLIGPLVEARLAGTVPPGDDMMQWLIDSSPAEERNVDRFAQMLLQLSMASIHTTSMTVTKALYDLASRPEYTKPLREEVETVLKEEGGFTQNGIRRLDLIDSFLKESQRLGPIGNMTMRRKVVGSKGFTFSNGVHIPHGATILGVTSAAASLDPEIFENPEEFDGYRFLKLRQEDPNKHVFSSTSTYHWGLGKHACPGRFFASTEIKMLLAEIVVRYDIRIKDNKRPADICWGISNSPDVSAFVEFRARQDIL